MVKIIHGDKGEGKTKELIKLANECEVKGNKVYLTNNDRHIHDLNIDVRYVNIIDYDVATAYGLLSFIRGMLAANSDYQAFFVDGLFDICNEDHTAIIKFFEKIGKYSEMFDIDVVLTVGLSDDELPDFIKQYI